MAQITVYTVEVHGTVEVQADSAEEARTQGLQHFAQAPMNYISVTGQHQVLVPDQPQ